MGPLLFLTVKGEQSYQKHYVAYVFRLLTSGTKNYAKFFDNCLLSLNHSTIILLRAQGLPLTCTLKNQQQQKNLYKVFL